MHLESAITIDMDIKLYYNKSNHDRGQNLDWGRIWIGLFGL